MRGLLHDRVQIFFDPTTGKYHIVFIKNIIATAESNDDFIYARIDVDVLPEQPEISRGYYGDNPITLENIGFWARCDVLNITQVKKLNEYNSNIELAIPTRGCMRADGVVQVRYGYNASMFQWGSWLQREVRVPTDYLSVMLIFPKNTVNCSALKIVGGIESRLPGRVRNREIGNSEVWHWLVRNPLILDRYRFSWTFFDRRDERIRQRIIEEYGRPGQHGIEFSDTWRTAIWFTLELTFSEGQAKILEYLDNNRRRFTRLKQEEVLEGAELRSGRVRDVFKKHPAFGSLVKVERGFVRLDDSYAAFEEYGRRAEANGQAPSVD